MWRFRNIDRPSQTFNWLVPRCLIYLVILIESVMSGQRFSWAESKPKSRPVRPAVRVDENGTRFVNKIPYDVFFENPLQVVASHQNVAVAPTTNDQPIDLKPDHSKVTAKAVTPSEEFRWQVLLPMEELQGEIKTIRSNLTKSLANPGQFNQNFKSIAVDGAELAALAVIVQEHGESLSWKDKAPYVRDFGIQINQSAIGLGKENFDKTKSAFQRLSTALDGSIPADAGDVPTVRPLNETASRKALMKRIEKAKDWLKQDVNSEAKFQSKSDQIRHEAAILSALATVITTSGYEYAENDDYQMFAKSLIEGAKTASEAVGDESYEKFKQSVDRVNKSCTDCHSAYGNG